MKRLLMSLFSACMIAASLPAEAEPALKPTSSFLFAEREDGQLWMDIYAPARGTEKLNLPTVL